MSAVAGLIGLANKCFRGEFTEDVKDEVVVDFQRFYIKIGGMRFDVKMKYVSILSKQFQRTS